jgi:hypothetical protein
MKHDNATQNAEPTEANTAPSTEQPTSTEQIAPVETVKPIRTFAQLFSGVVFLSPARPEPYTFTNGTKRTPLADVLFEMGETGLIFSGAQIVDEQNPKRGRSIQLRLPNKGKVGGYDALMSAESERDKAAFVQWHKDIVAQWATWRREQVKNGVTVKPSEIKADAVIYSDEDLIELGLLDSAAPTAKPTA